MRAHKSVRPLLFVFSMGIPWVPSQLIPTQSPCRLVFSQFNWELTGNRLGATPAIPRQSDGGETLLRCAARQVLRFRHYAGVLLEYNLSGATIPGSVIGGSIIPADERGGVLRAFTPFLDKNRR